MEDDDWIKFGYRIWSAHHGRLRTQILQRFKEAWFNIYNTQPYLVDGAPADFLDNLLYRCSQPVPWQLEFNLPPDVSSSPLPSSPIPEPNPGNDNNREQLSTTSNIHDDLVQIFKSLDYVIDHSGTFSKIKNGFLSGFVNHITQNHQNTRLRVIFPIVPHYCRVPGSRVSFDMSSVTIDKEDAEALLRVEPRCLSLSTDQSKCRPKFRYICCSWLCIAFEMLEHPEMWDIQFMNWPSFSSALLARSGTDWKLICSAHLLIGGINFTNNFLEKCSDYYGLSPSDMEKVWSTTLGLTSIMTIWPDPRDLLMAGSKLFLETIIQEASSFANFSHPQVAEVEPSVDIIHQITSGKLAAVLKREFSSHGRHIFKQNTLNPLAKLKMRLEEENEAYSETNVFPRPRWFLSPYNASLRYLGEIRSFVINGILFMSIITLPTSESASALNIVEPILFTPLSRLSLTFEERSSDSHPGLASNFLSPHQEEGSHADYILPLLYRLIVAEEHITKRRSGMRVFVRMDISVFQSRGKFSYVVNELTRSHQTSLFAEHGGGRTDFAFQDITKVLHFIAYDDDCKRNMVTI